MTTTRDDILKDFIRESNAIEGIFEVRQTHIDAHRKFLDLDEISISDLQELVYYLQPDANLRDRVGMDVYVGNHNPPPGGPDVPQSLDNLLVRVMLNGLHGINPYHAHCEYETLHPFQDGNGRSGRALWLWHMKKERMFVPGRSFLHHWYYQSLQFSSHRS